MLLALMKGLRQRRQLYTYKLTKTDRTLASAWCHERTCMRMRLADIRGAFSSLVFVQARGRSDLQRLRFATYHCGGSKCRSRRNERRAVCRCAAPRIRFLVPQLCRDARSQIFLQCQGNRHGLPSCRERMRSMVCLASATASAFRGAKVLKVDRGKIGRSVRARRTHAPARPLALGHDFVAAISGDFWRSDLGSLQAGGPPAKRPRMILPPVSLSQAIPTMMSALGHRPTSEQRADVSAKRLKAGRTACFRVVP